MPIYIVRPRQPSALRTAGLISRQLTPTRRQAQIAEVESLRNAEPAYGLMRKWLNQVATPTVKRLTHETTSRVTGTAVLDMSDEEAAQLQKDVPDVVVLKDRPLDLIRPRRQVATARTKVGSSDLWHVRAIGLESARRRGFRGTGQGVGVAVLDTGVDATHHELQGKVAQAFTFDVPAWTWHPQAPSRDTDGHGTHVAGLICGTSVGTAPGATVVSGVMLPQGRGNLSDFLLALEWAATQETIQIVNMSAGIPGYLPEMQEAVTGVLGAGLLPVFAVGNEGRNRTRSPGNYTDPLSVGASNAAGQVASFSGSGFIVAGNHQYAVPDLVSPGEGVYSSVIGGGYEAWDGTSMATPIVAGVAALVLERHPEITIPDLIEELLRTCRDLGEEAERQGKGLVQVTTADAIEARVSRQGRSAAPRSAGKGKR